MAGTADGELAKPPYQFPTGADKDGWQKQIKAAIVNGSLNWTHVADSQWIISGKCPRCDHSTAEFKDISVVAADAIAPANFGSEIGPDIRLEIACLCDETPPHKKDWKGCGAGRGLEISVARP